MTTPSGIGWGVDVYRAKFIPISSTGAIDHPGYPDLLATEPYEGLEFSRPKSFVANFGNPRTITNVAQGRVQDTILLPSTDAKTSEGHLSNVDLVTFAKLGNVKTRTIAGGIGMALGTDQQGLEAAGILLVAQLAFHDDEGNTKWHSIIYPRARGVVNYPGMNDTPTDVKIDFSLSPSKKHVSGEVMTINNDGTLEQTGYPLITDERFDIIAWLADGAEDTFLLPTNKQAVDFANAFEIWDYEAGTEITAAITKSETGVVFDSAPAASKLMVALYQY